MAKNKPYITIELNRNEIKNAYLYTPIGRELRLDPYKVARTINFYGDGFYDEIAPNKFLIDDERIIKRFYAQAVARRNNRIGKAVISIGLALTLVVGANEFTKGDSQVIEENPKLSTEEFIERNDEETTIFKSNITYSAPNVINQEPEINMEEVFSFDYKDRTTSEKYNYADTNYADLSAEMATIYGLDPNLVLAIITQENPYNEINNTNVGANGITQIESIWFGEVLSAFNFKENNYETITVDSTRLSDPEYALKVGCMILRNYYDSIYNNFVKSNILNESEGIVASVVAYNKGITAITKLIKTYGSDYLNHLEEVKGGDNLYSEHVFSYIEDGKKLNIHNRETDPSQVYIDNLQNSTFLK